MPSDLAKKKAAKKKEAAKSRQAGTKKTDEFNGENDQPESQENGADSNGEMSENALKSYQLYNPFWINMSTGWLNINYAKFVTLSLLGIYISALFQWLPLTKGSNNFNPHANTLLGLNIVNQTIVIDRGG